MVKRFFRQLFITACITIMCAVFSFNEIKAQSGHAKLWNIFDKCLDFTWNELKISDMPEELYNASWYVDSNGVLQLYSKNGLFDADGNMISPEPVDFFIPKPGDENLIYCFTISSYYYIVDLKTHSAIEKSDELQYSFPDTHLTVHHANCRDIWILFNHNSTISKYLLTPEGIAYKGTCQLPSEMSINLSKDGNLFTGISTGTKHHIYFGTFDRNTAEFQVTNVSADLSREYIGLSQSIISPNMTKLYVCGCYTGMRKVIFEIPMINGTPDYEMRTEIKVYPRHVPYQASLFYYGPDGNIYTYTYGNFGVIKTDTNNEIVFEDELITCDCKVSPPLDFVATWLSDNPCDSSPCPQMSAPKIVIEN